MFFDDDFTIFENHTIRTGSKLLRKMGYEGKCLGINDQGIANPIKVEELPCQEELGYVRKEVGECDEIAIEPPTIEDEKPSSVISNSTRKVKNVDFPSISSSHSMISIGDVEILIIGTNMRLLTRMRYKEEEELGANNQGITQPLEVVHEHRFVGSRYTQRECLKVSESSETSMKLSRKENDGNTSPSSHDSAHCRERAEESSQCHTDIRDNKGRYNHFRSSNAHFDYNHVFNHEQISWH